MQFHEYLKAEGLSITSVAREWGVSISTLSRPIKGERWPSDLVLVRAYIMSGGRVGLADWIETCRELLESNGTIERESDGKEGPARGVD